MKNIIYWNIIYINKFTWMRRIKWYRLHNYTKKIDREMYKYIEKQKIKILKTTENQAYINRNDKK